MAILPFMLYQLAGFGTLHFVVSKAVNWAINIAIFCLIVASYAANRMNDFQVERVLTAVLVVIVAVTTIYGILKLRAMQVTYDAHVPMKEKDKDK
jgi:predicted Na+-dependent transporter